MKALVAFGTIDIVNGPTEWMSGLIPESDYHIHQNFSLSTFTNNIALIYVNEMPESIMTSANIKTVQLPTEDDLKTNLTGRDGVVSGFGITSPTVTSSNATLYHITNKILPKSSCEAVPLYTVTESTLCFDTAGNRSICAGDSGSPLVVEISSGRTVLAGIGSFSVGGCTLLNPAMFESVFHHSAWIEKTINGSTIVNLSMSLLLMAVAMILKNFN